MITIQEVSVCGPSLGVIVLAFASSSSVLSIAVDNRVSGRVLLIVSDNIRTTLDVNHKDQG